MKNLNFTFRVFATILTLFSFLPLRGQSGEPDKVGLAKQPNVLLILTDDQGYGDVGFNGNPLVRTPTLDRMAAEAVVFDRFHAYPVCSPTRASLMTGRYAIRTGVIDTQEGASLLRPSEITLAKMLQQAGYRTGMFGKWHLGDSAPSRPMDHGFDVSLTHVGGMIGAPYSLLDANSYFDPILVQNGVEQRFQGYCMDVFTDAAIDFIREGDDEPFFLYWAPNTPHHPLTVEDRYADPYRKAGLTEETSRYYGMITNIDDNFRRMLEVLDEKGISENTLIIFVGDNGTSSLHQQHDLWEPALRGRKTFVYEGGIRVPMFVKLPGAQAVARRLSAIASVEDIMPTILEVCGLPALNGLDGASLVSLVRGETESHSRQTFFVQFHRGATPVRYRNMAVIKEPHKLVQPVGRGAMPFSEETMAFELYDLSADPRESQDLASLHPEIVAGMKAAYDEWFDDVTAAGFEPVPLWIGEEGQGKIRLSRQDWRGGGLFDGDLGYYTLEVRSPGTYRITCRWSELLGNTHPVTLKIGEKSWHREILYAEAQCRFEEVKLPAGVTRLEAWVDIDGKKNGFRFIEIEKVDDD
jgi:arylsulfatase/arylsulfatase A